VSDRVAPASPHGPDGFDALIGIVVSGEATDIARREKAYMADVLDARYHKKMGDVATGRPRREEGHRDKPKT